MPEPLPRLRKPGDLAPLLDLLADHSAVAELGVFAGDATRQFLACTRVKLLVCVDKWVGGYDADDQASNADMAAAERQFDQLVADDRRVTKLKADTVTAAALIPDASLDLVYVDADHRYEQVLRDLQAWLPKVRPGGLIAGHDYTDPGHPGVERAVRVVFPNGPDFLFLDTSWAITTPSK